MYYDGAVNGQGVKCLSTLTIFSTPNYFMETDLLAHKTCTIHHTIIHTNIYYLSHETGNIVAKSTSMQFRFVRIVKELDRTPTTAL